MLHVALNLLLFGGGVRLKHTSDELACPAVDPPSPRLMALVNAARTKALEPGSLRSSPVTVALVDCLPYGLIAHAGQQEIELSLADLETILDTHRFSDEAATDYLAFVLAHEAEHLRQHDDTTCSDLDAELEADRAAARQFPRSLEVLGDLLEAKLGDLRSALENQTPREIADTCVNLLELSVRSHALVSNLATSNRAHHYFSSLGEMYEMVEEQYAWREEMFDLLLAHCEHNVKAVEPAVKAVEPSCSAQRLEKARVYRSEHPDALPPSWRGRTLPGPWPRFADTVLAVDVGAGFGAHWLEDEVGQPREARMGPSVDLELWHPDDSWRSAKRAGGIGAGGAVGYQSLPGREHAAAHRLTLGLRVGLMKSVGRMAGGVTMGLGWGHDFRPDRDVDAMAFRLDFGGAVRLHTRLDGELSVGYGALFAAQDLRRSGERGEGYSHGVLASIALISYFGRR